MYNSVHKDKKALGFQVEKQPANLVHALSK